MGEIIRNLGKIRIGKSEYKVELNTGTRNDGKYDIHIQNDEVRLNISEYDFCRMAAALIYADEKIRKYKKRGDETLC